MALGGAGALSSGLVAALGRNAPLYASGFVFTLADRLRPARRVEDLATAGSSRVELMLAAVFVLEGMCIDFGLSAVVLDLVVLLLASGTVLVDWMRV